jgi:CHAD domain-containing protein
MGFQWSLEDGSIGGGFVRIAREQIDKAIAIAEDANDTPARRVHEARRRAKKLRALLRLVRPDFGHYAQENAHVRDAARGLSAARDVKVAADTLIDLMAWAGCEKPLITLAVEPGNEEAGLAEFAVDMRRMLSRSEHWKTGKIDLDTLARGLTDTYRKGLEAMHLVSVNPSDTAFHEWRKHAKYHWNQIGLLEACAEDILPSAHKAVGDLSDELGLHHDLAMLRERLNADDKLFGDIDTGFVLDAATRRQAGLEAAIGVLGRQVYAETPKGLHARFTRYLEGWAAQEAAE